VPDPAPASTPILSVVTGAIGGLAALGVLLLWPSGDPGPDVPALSSFEGVYTATTVGACVHGG
jgi:hypothetical protein